MIIPILFLHSQLGNRRTFCQLVQMFQNFHTSIGLTLYLVLTEGLILLLVLANLVAINYKQLVSPFLKHQVVLFWF